MKTVKLVILIFFMFVSPSWAAYHYIRAGASGDGSSWTNALSDIPATLIRGDTYYIASGSYGGHTFNSLSGSGSTYVYLKKATEADHGSGTGWNSSYGTGQAVFSSGGAVFIIHMTYLSIDGVTGSGTSGHGIKLVTTGTVGNNGSTILSYASAPNNLVLKHLELSAPDPNGDLSNFNLNCQVWPGPTNTLFQYLYIHGGLVGVLFTGSNQIMEHSYLKNNGGQGHAEMVCASNVQNLTLRYNVFENMLSTTEAGAGTTYIEPQVNGGAIPNGIYIYGNVFKGTVANENTNNPSMFSSTSGEQVLNVHIYNNTVYGLHGSVWKDTGIRGDAANSTITARNNVWQACLHGPGFQSVQIQDYNILNTGEVSFYDAANGDFHLTQPTSPGIALPSPYNLDPDGKVRGADGVWDKGAYEYGGGESLTVPRSLRMITN
jgi:hypothetical protein